MTSDNPHKAKGIALLQRGDLSGAETALRAALAESAGDPAILAPLGICLQAMGRRREAFDSFMQALNADPDFVPALLGAGRMLARTGQAEKALELLDRAGRLAPGNWPVAGARIEVLVNNGRTADAEGIAKSFVAANPDIPAAAVRLGEIRLMQGDAAEAARLAKSALSDDRNAPRALSLLAETSLEEDSSALLQRIEAALADTAEGHPDWINLQYTAARQFDKLGRPAEAFERYARANVARKAQLERRREGYDRQQATREVEETIAAFDKNSFDGPAGSESDLPVFIIGMARSGTSLTEQILASHPSVAGGGELPLMGMITRRLRQEPGFPNALSNRHLGAAAVHYLNRLKAIGPNAARVTDKMPGNLRRLGLIAQMFPNARIIHTRRDAIDTCVSCFTQNFQFNGSAWTCELDDIAHQYGLYLRLMEHWRAVLPPGRMLEIDYEDTVSDLEAQAHRLVDFVGLPWDDACLRFHETGRAVATPSRAQVHRPIYRSSVGRWKKYGETLRPLIDGLEACGIEAAE